MNSFTKNITTIGRCANQFRSDFLEGTGLKGGQHSLITNLCRQPGISQEQLSKLTYMNKSNVARHLATLEDNGFVTRKYSETDKRVMLVYPTDKAFEVLPSITETHRAWRAYVTESFTEEELELFSSLLERAAERAKTYVDNRDNKLS